MDPSRRTRFLIVLFALLVAVQALVATGAAGYPADPGSSDSSDSSDSSAAQSQGSMRELRAEADGQVFVSMRQSTGVAGFVRVSRNGDLLPSSDASTASGKAQDFFERFGSVFGIHDLAQLKRVSASTDRYRATHLTYIQVFKGVPVFGAVLKAHVDSKRRLTSVNGVFVPDVALGTSPQLSKSEAAERAEAEVAAHPPTDQNGKKARTSGLTAKSTRLMVFRLGLVRDVAGGTNQLAYEVEVTNTGSSIREFVYVHAHAGKILNRYSTVHDALHRVLYEMDETTPPIWEEGDPFPGTLNQDQQNIVNASGHSYYHFFNAFGRDSYDGAGAFMRSVNNDPDIACPNANWNGATTNYCNGVTADDVVAHEWGHAYTQYTHDLIYQWQSGALNEAYSDIWGETVDFLNGYGTDTPDLSRTAGNCTSHSLERDFVVINSPGSIAGFCNAGSAAFGPPLTETGVTGDVVLVDDGVAATSNGCETPFVSDVTGKIALIDRGVCAFTVKVANAQAEGAIGVLIADNVWGPPDPLGGVDPSITIPSVRIPLGSGNTIKGALPGVNVTMRHNLPSTQDNFRWLVGEDATAFGTAGRHAIRDMWNPRCVNDPGRVTDAEYFCATTDGGGVHTNSGIPNHGYALLVDGGTYNGHTVGAIGLTKASHLYFRAQSVYQGPTTDFDGHADALLASCNDLVVAGANLEGLSTSSTPAGPSGQVFAAADCAQVEQMIAAVELRIDPAEQCNFQPVLQPDAPAHCVDTEAETDPVNVYVEDFEDGLGDWTLTNDGVFEGWDTLGPYDWAHDTTLPAERPGAAAFAIDPDEGNCDGGAGDVSGHMMLTSGEIAIPDIDETTPRLSFEHYVATEAGWDGGNLKISVNGGSFFVPPDAAYTFNSYNVPNLNTVAQGNTNPLAGEDGWTGTDGGELTSSWGESQLNLAALGVVPGDTIQLRFDFGIDGCTGLDGWYVDNVTVYLCVNADPTIEIVAGGACNTANSATINLAVSDAETDAGDLVLSGSSSNTNLVPNSGLAFGGSGADRTLRVTASKNASGTAVVTVTVTDEGGGTASTQLTVIVGTNAPNVLEGTSGPDMILGRGGNDTIDGLEGIDLLCGWNGDDTLNGGSEDDTVSGGRGDDTLTGETGADRFSGGSGTDVATDFNAGEGDTSTGIP
jgi:Zn-dependent metalloprotease